VLNVLEFGYSIFLRLRPSWRRAATPPNALPLAVVADLRTDHAGEVGAVQIYRGILAIARDSELRAFAARHLAAELLHLRRIRQWLPASARSRLSPLWRVAGWLTGAMPALLSPHAVYVTVAAVERFVDRHYGAQIERLSAHPDLAALREALAACRRDEIAHRDDALARLHARPGAFARVWSAVVGKGSELAVAASRRL
jgi:demethoxyubiquinone hydroxylase (CLK1/Coq7/Cat5 family)